MRNITHKIETKRTAAAEAFIHVPSHLIDVVRSRKTEKGDALEVARVAAVMGAKKTWEIIPFCHQIPMSRVDVHYAFEADGIRITVTSDAIAQTGVEMESMTAAAVCALTLYDMLKPYDATVEIGHVKLLSKTGGKSDFVDRFDPAIPVAVLVVNSLVASGEKDDAAGRRVVERLEALGFVDLAVHEVIGEDAALVGARVAALSETHELVLTVGGTGVGIGDVVVDVVTELLDRDLPGIMEAARHHGQRRTPRALMSGGVAGLRGDALVITLPGSTGGVEDTLDALLPNVLHVVRSMRKDPHRERA